MNISKPKIKLGYLDSFCIFKAFDPRLIQHANFLESFNKTNVLISKEKFTEENGYELSFTKSFEELISKRKDVYNKSEQLGEQCPKYILEDFKEEIVCNIFIGESEFSLPGKIDVLDLSQQKKLDLLAENNNMEKHYTSLSPTTFKNRYLLQPFRIKNFGSDLYAGVYLNLYKNGLAILHVSVPISGYSFEKIGSSVWDISFSEVLVPKYLEKSSSNENSYLKIDSEEKLNIRYVQKLYSDYLKNLTGSISADYDEYYDLITLMDYGFRPSNFDNLSTNFNKTIYDLLTAPMTEFNQMNQSYIDNLIKDSFFPMSNFFRYYVSSTGRTVATYTSQLDEVIENNVEESIREKYGDLKGKDLKELKSSEEVDDYRKFLFEKLYSASVNGIMTPIEHILLKKHSHKEFLYIDLNQNMSISELLKTKIKLFDQYDEILFSRYKFRFGSLKKLVEFIESKADIFLQGELVKDRIYKIEELINLKNEEKKNKFTSILGFTTVAVTLFLSLPTIKEIMDFFNLSNYSIIVWLAINVVIWIVLFRVVRGSIIKEFTVVLRKTKLSIDPILRKLKEIFKHKY